MQIAGIWVNGRTNKVKRYTKKLLKALRVSKGKPKKRRTGRRNR